MKLKTEQYEIKDIETVANLLKEGKVVAFPTDTVYGLACIYDNEEALKALKACKIRPEEKPIPTMVSSFRQMEEIAIMSEEARDLAEEFMPGAFTMVLKKNENLPDYLTNGFTLADEDDEESGSVVPAPMTRPTAPAAPAPQKTAKAQTKRRRKAILARRAPHRKIG